MIGASGGLSGLFAGVLIHFNDEGRLSFGTPGDWKNLVPVTLLWVGISILFSFMMSGGAVGGSIAWAAHIGGFFGGLFLFRRFRSF